MSIFSDYKTKAFLPDLREMCDLMENGTIVVTSLATESTAKGGDDYSTARLVIEMTLRPTPKPKHNT